MCLFSNHFELQLGVYRYFTHLKLRLKVARHNFREVKIAIVEVSGQMVNNICFYSVGKCLLKIECN